MKALTKAMLISALIFPGLGHPVLRPGHGARGLLFLLPAAAILLSLLRDLMQISEALLAELERGALAFDPLAIAARAQAAAAGDAALNLLSLLFLACWAAALADLWWLDRNATR
jgi:hypothetical protein